MAGLDDAAGLDGSAAGNAGDEMRAADADRAVVADRLRVALDQGRLDLHEYDQRLQRAYSAKTYGELNGLLADLPSPVHPQRAQLTPRGAESLSPAVGAATSSSVTVRWLIETWDSYVAVVSITAVSWFLLGATGGFWPIWVAGPWGAILLWQTVTGLASGEPQRWAAKKERKRERRRAREAAAGQEPAAD